MNRFSIALGLMMLLTLPTHALERVMYESDMTNYVTKADVKLDAVLSEWDLSQLPEPYNHGTVVLTEISAPWPWLYQVFAPESTTDYLPARQTYQTLELAEAATNVVMQASGGSSTVGSITRSVTAYRLGPDTNTNPNRNRLLAPADCISREALQAALANINTNIVTAEDARVALTNLIVTLRNL